MVITVLCVFQNYLGSNCSPVLQKGGESLDFNHFFTAETKRVYEFNHYIYYIICVQVLAKRKEGSGKVKVLLHWTPEDM